VNDLAVTDTHALIWASSGQLPKLGRAARKLFEQAEARRATIYVPTLVLVEMGNEVHRGRIVIESGFDDWVAALFASGGFAPIELTTAIVLRAEQLYAIPEGTDRLIAATARELELPLITRDPEIERAAGVRTIW
jgi:PIN domain nuclease of toxin-antitoxin system